MGHFWFIVSFVCVLAFYGFAQTKLRKMVRYEKEKKRKVEQEKYTP